MYEGLGRIPESQGAPLTAADLVDTFGAMANDLLRSGKAQRLGNKICPYNGPLTITNRRKKQGRVTHISITGEAIGSNRFPVTHEIHFPSRDSKNKDYGVSCAIFVTHEYDEQGEVMRSQSQTVEEVELDNTALVDFLFQVNDACDLAMQPAINN